MGGCLIALADWWKSCELLTACSPKVHKNMRVWMYEEWMCTEPKNMRKQWENRRGCPNCL